MSHALGTVGKRVFSLLLAAGRSVRLMLTGNVHQGGGASFVAALHDREALDAAAGCEFVDDRIRFQD